MAAIRSLSTPTIPSSRSIAPSSAIRKCFGMHKRNHGLQSFHMLKTSSSAFSHLLISSIGRTPQTSAMPGSWVFSMNAQTSFPCPCYEMHLLPSRWIPRILLRQMKCTSCKSASIQALLKVVPYPSTSQAHSTAHISPLQMKPLVSQISAKTTTPVNSSITSPQHHPRSALLGPVTGSTPSWSPRGLLKTSAPS